MTSARPIDSLLQKFPTAKRIGKDYRVACPVCGARRGVLSIRETSDGTVLVRCFRSCNTVDVLDAVGLRMADLFASARSREPMPVRVNYVPSAVELQNFIKDETIAARDKRVTQNEFDTPRYRAADINAARRRARMRYGVPLKDVRRFAWEGWEPHDRDAAWPEYFARALDEVRAESRANVDDDLPEVTPSIEWAAVQRAAAWLQGRSR